MPVKFCLTCRKLTRNGSRCEDCQRAMDRARNQRRGTTTQRGLGWEHQQRAKAALANEAAIAEAVKKREVARKIETPANQFTTQRSATPADLRESPNGHGAAAATAR